VTLCKGTAEGLQLIMNDTRALMAAGSGGFMVLNVADPTSISFLNSYTSGTSLGNDLCNVHLLI
jgi:hypothetical protein